MDFNVLLPLDGSSFSHRILSRVDGLLDPTRHHLILMRVAPPPKGVMGIPPRMLPLDGNSEFIPDYKSASDLELSQHPIYASQAWESLKADISHELNPDVRTLQNAGFEVSLLVHFGEAAEEILQAVRQHAIDFVVIATHARKGLERMILGSVTEHVLHHSHVPIVMLRPDENMQDTNNIVKHILIPLDETVFSRRVLKHVMRLFEPSKHQLTLLRVAPHPEGVAPDEIRRGIPGVHDIPNEQTRLRLEQEHSSYYTRLTEDRKEELLSDMDESRALLERAGFKVACAVRFGKTGEEISDAVTFTTIDMVVMATHSREGLERLVLGSVAKEVLSRVHVPVMMVRPHREVASETLPRIATSLAKNTT